MYYLTKLFYYWPVFMNSLFFFPLVTDFIIWIFVTVTLYRNFIFLQNYTFHIARSLHSPFYATFPSRGISPNHSLSDCMFIVVVHLLSCVWLFAISWTVARQSPLSLGFLDRGYWSGKNIGVGYHFLFQWILY